jgi:putative transposase
VGVASDGRSDDQSSVGKKDGSSEAIEEGTGPNPTDRGKSGTKRSLLTDGRGIPLAVAIAGANRHDCKLVQQTLTNMIVERPKPTGQAPQHMCMDAGYDGGPVYQLLEEWGYIAHIRSRYDEKVQLEHVPGYRARRWVVERTHSWLNRFRRLLIRWEKKVENYTAMMHLHDAPRLRLHLLPC